MTPCPACGAERRRMIYLALPGWICLGEAADVGGLAGFAASLLPLETDEGFKFMTYEQGQYFPALRAWLKRP